MELDGLAFAFRLPTSFYWIRYIICLVYILTHRWGSVLFFDSWLMPLVDLATMPTCTEGDMRRHANSIPIVIPVLQSAALAASLTMCVVAMKNALFWAIKISEFGKWVVRHNGDNVIQVTSDDVTGDQKVAQPSRVHATKSVALATQWCLPEWVYSGRPWGAGFISVNIILLRSGGKILLGL